MYKSCLEKWGKWLLFLIKTGTRGTFSLVFDCAGTRVSVCLVPWRASGQASGGHGLNVAGEWCRWSGAWGFTVLLALTRGELWGRLTRRRDASSGLAKAAGGVLLRLAAPWLDAGENVGTPRGVV